MADSAEMTARLALRILAIAAAWLATIAPGCLYIPVEDIPVQLEGEWRDPDTFRTGMTPYKGDDAATITLALNHDQPEGKRDVIVLYIATEAPRYLVYLLGDLGGSVGSSTPWNSQWRQHNRTNSVKGSVDRWWHLRVSRRIDGRLPHLPWQIYETCFRGVDAKLTPSRDYVITVANAGGGCEFTVAEMSR